MELRYNTVLLCNTHLWNYISNAVEMQLTIDSLLQGWAGATRHRLSMRLVGSWSGVVPL